MSTALKLVIFDVDGTLLDSQAMIVAAMRNAFGEIGQVAPERADILGIVGLSLPQAMAVLAPDASEQDWRYLEDAYKRSFLALRKLGEEAPETLYPGARETIQGLDQAGILVSAATGKARRGLDHFLDKHALRQHFIATQSADDAPSKPHPGMVMNCLQATGVESQDAVIVGDTEFDMEMGRAAGVRRIGVAWGYHPIERVQRGGAEEVARDFPHLDELIAGLWR